MEGGSREAINGYRKLPQGYRLDESYEAWKEAYKRVKDLNKAAKKQKTGFTYNAQGVTGDIKILCYTGKSVIDRRFAHS